MAKQFFTLAGRATCPDHGESLGAALAKAAYDREDVCRVASGNTHHWYNVVAEMLHLAADAYEAGAAVSLGHNRAGRYEAAAREHRAHAAALMEEGRALHEARENEVLQAAFAAGYDDTNHSDMGRFSFDRRDAYLLGVHYGQRQMPVPALLRSVYNNGDHWLEADGKRFRVNYPGGKIDAATATVEALA